MSIQRKPKTSASASRPQATSTAEDAFIERAPDARGADPQSSTPYEKGVPKGNKRQITLTITSELLRKVDETARRTGQARAAVINMAIFRALEGDVFK